MIEVFASPAPPLLDMYTYLEQRQNICFSHSQEENNIQSTCASCILDMAICANGHVLK